MTIENKLKNLILERYKSIREFSLSIDMPYSTIDSIFKRGIGNSSVTNVIKICKALRLSVDALANGELLPISESTKSSEIVDVNDLVHDVKSKLSHSDNLVFEGRAIEIEIVEPIIDALDIGFEMSRKKSVKKESTKAITESLTK